MCNSVIIIHMKEFIIKRRKLTTKEIDLLILEIKKTSFMAGHSRREWHNFSNVFAAEVEGKIAGVCVVIDLGFNWVEIGAIIVLEKYRGLKIGKQLFEQSYEFAKKQNKNIYIVSRNPIVKKWMKERGMILANHVFNLPFPIIWHDFVMFFSLFRIIEFFRKSFLYRNMPEYIYGYKLNIFR